MLRAVIVAMAVMAASMGWCAGYEEPTQEVLDAQRQTVGRVLSQAQGMSQSQELLEQLKREQEAMLAVPNRPSVGSSMNFGAMPGQIMEDGFLSRALAAGQQVMEGMESGHRETGPIVLVSFSMADDAIRSLIEEAHRAGGAVVVRGLINNSFPETVTRLQKLANGSEGGLAIDPTVFRRFGIEQVPAFVLPVEPLRACTPEGCPESDAVTARGSASLVYFLDLVSRTSSNALARERAQDFLFRMEADAP